MCDVNDNKNSQFTGRTEANRSGTDSNAIKKVPLFPLTTFGITVWTDRVVGKSYFVSLPSSIHNKV